MKITQSIRIALVPVALVCASCTHENENRAQSPAPNTSWSQSQMTPAAGTVQPNTSESMGQQPAGQPSPSAQPEQQPQPGPEGTMQAPEAQMESGTSGPTATEMPAQPLKDSQIDAILTEVNRSEIELGKKAMHEATHPRVKRFAALVVKQHSILQTELDKVAHQLALSPEASSLLSQLESDAEATRQNLGSLHGADFDTAYIDSQVKALQRVLGELNNRLLPQATRLKSLVTNSARPLIEEHLLKAQRIQKALTAP